MRLFMWRTNLRARLGPCTVAIHGLGSSGGSKGFKPPSRLLHEDGTRTQERTVYTVRLSTGRRRGSALSDMNAGVQLCLISKDGRAFLYRVPALHDPEEVERELHRICQIVDHSSGANCFLAIGGAERAQRRAGAAGRPATKHRFLEGGVDEVSFLGPELGTLRAVLVGPEAGRWYCDEIDVYSSRTGHTDRFICREFLGDKSDHPAAYLTPIAPDAVVYGSGGDAVVLSKEQAAQLYALNMAQYGDLKARLLAINAGLVAAGTAAIFAHSGSPLSAPFALGGASGMLYQFLLMAGVDSVGLAGTAPYKAQEIKPGPGLLMQLAMASPAGRTALKAGGLMASFVLLHFLSTQTGVAEQPGGELKQLLAAFAGFLMYKWAIIGAAVIPDQQLSQAFPGAARDKSKVDDKLE